MVRLKKENKEINNNWNILFTGIRINDRLAIHYQLIYILRRMAFVLIAYYGDVHIVFQLMATMVNQVLMISYVAAARPFKDRALNFLELFNELTIMMVIYMLFLITDFCTETFVKNMTGYAIIYITIFNMAVNLSIMVY